MYKKWMDIKQVIDNLHIKNHKDPLCLQQYNPIEVITDDNMNTMTHASKHLPGYHVTKKFCVQCLKSTTISIYTGWSREEMLTYHGAIA